MPRSRWGGGRCKWPRDSAAAFPGAQPRNLHPSRLRTCCSVPPRPAVTTARLHQRGARSLQTLEQPEESGERAQLRAWGLLVRGCLGTGGFSELCSPPVARFPAQHTSSSERLLLLAGSVFSHFLAKGMGSDKKARFSGDTRLNIHKPRLWMLLRAPGTDETWRLQLGQEAPFLLARRSLKGD